MSEEKELTRGEQLRRALVYERKNGWDRLDAEEGAALEAYCTGYKQFLDAGKTERECVDRAIAQAEAAGFRAYVRGMELKPGDRIYQVNRDKAIMLAVMGRKGLEHGVNIGAAHIDSPRLDLKQNPLYESDELGFFKTHYYGGIRKYQWVTIPLELHGVVALKNGEVVRVSPDTETFMPKLDEFEEKITKRTRAVIINNPNNPTGVVYGEDTIKALAAILEKKEKELGISILLISDEPYRELAYGVEVPYVTKYYHNTVVGYSYSKSLSIPGERIGYLVIPDEVDESGELITAASIANRVLGCVNAPSLIQKVIQYCIRHKVTVNVEAYEKNRDLLYHALKEDGFTCAKPDGAFYLFVKSPVPDEKEFCETAKKHHVLMVPGSSFACPGYVRIAYCVSHEQIERSLPAFREIAREYGLLK